MKKIIAAGGLVFNENEELLLIFRRGKWDLPKGKLDENETIETCAVREVEEETGIANVKLIRFITKTHHEYFDKWLNKDVLKETWWYLMRVDNSPQLIPQTSEDIEEAIWANKLTIEKCLLNTYPTIKNLLKEFYNQTP